MAELADAWTAEGVKNIWGNIPVVHADAVRRRRRRHAARLAAERCAHDDFHRLAGPAADAAQHVQDRRGIDAVRVPRRGARARNAGAVDLRRPLGRDERAHDRVRDARRGLGAGGARPRAGRAGGDARIARADHVFLRRLSHVARRKQDLDHSGRADPGDDRRRAGARVPCAGAVTRASGRARHRAQPGHVLPGARDGQSLLRTLSRDRSEDDGPARCVDRAALSAFPLFRGPDAERVVVAIGSACEVLDETAAYLNAKGEKLGVLAGDAVSPVVPRKRSSPPCRAR